MNHNEIPEKPILMSAPILKAALADLKTQTRRIVKPQPGPEITEILHADDDIWLAYIKQKYGQEYELKCPYGQPGHRLWVRENWRTLESLDHVKPRDLYAGTPVHYNADEKPEFDILDYGRGRPSIHMPRIFARIILEITGIRIERLQDISEADARAEGIGPCLGLSTCGGSDQCHDCEYDHPREWFQNLWESINGPGSWAVNPWVWVVEFKRVTE